MRMSETRRKTVTNPTQPTKQPLGAHVEMVGFNHWRLHAQRTVDIFREEYLDEKMEIRSRWIVEVEHVSRINWTSCAVALSDAFQRANNL